LNACMYMTYWTGNLITDEARFVANRVTRRD
jgi:hypothetical protein